MNFHNLLRFTMNEAIALDFPLHTTTHPSLRRRYYKLAKRDFREMTSTRCLDQDGRLAYPLIGRLHRNPQSIVSLPQDHLHVIGHVDRHYVRGILHFELIREPLDQLHASLSIWLRAAACAHSLEGWHPPALPSHPFDTFPSSSHGHTISYYPSLALVSLWALQLHQPIPMTFTKSRTAIVITNQHTTSLNTRDKIRRAVHNELRSLCGAVLTTTEITYEVRTIIDQREKLMNNFRHSYAICEQSTPILFHGQKPAILLAP